jgi:hypothetical protein
LESFEGCQGSQGHILLNGDRGVSKENVLASIWLVDQVSGEFVEPPSVQIIGPARCQGLLFPCLHIIVYINQLSEGYISIQLQVESVLDKDVYSLEELLDEDDIIQECKSLNGRLINL